MRRSGAVAVCIVFALVLWGKTVNAEPRWLGQGELEFITEENLEASLEINDILTNNDPIRNNGQVAAIIGEADRFALLVQPQAVFRFPLPLIERPAAVDLDLRAGTAWLRTETPININLGPVQVRVKVGTLAVRTGDHRPEVWVFDGEVEAVDPMLGVETLAPAGSTAAWDGEQWRITNDIPKEMDAEFGKAELQLQIPEVADAAPGPPARIMIDAERYEIAADPALSLWIWAMAVDDSGRAVADETVVSFVTDSGTVQATAPTANGLAEALFIPSETVGRVRINAHSGDAAAGIYIETLPTGLEAPEIEEIELEPDIPVSDTEPDPELETMIEDLEPELEPEQ